MAFVDCEELRSIDMPKFNESYTPPSARPTGTMIELVVFWSNTALLILSLLVFAWAKFFVLSTNNKYKRYLDVRFFPTIVWTHLGALLSLICGSLAAIVPFDTFPCWVSMAAVLIPAFLVLPSAVRFFTFYRQYQITAAAQAATAILHGKTERGSIEDLRPKDREDDDMHLPLGYLIFGVFSLSPLHSRQKLRRIDGLPGENETNDLSKIIETIRKIRVLQALSSPKATLIILLTCTLPYVIAFAVLVGTSAFARSGCNTCPITQQPSARIILIVGACIPIGICAGALVFVRKIRDSLYVLDELRIAFICFGIPSIVFLTIPQALFLDQDFNPRILYQICFLGFALTQSAAPAIIVLYCHYRDLRRERRQMVEQMSESAVFANDTAELDACLANPALHEAFTNHLVA